MLLFFREERPEALYWSFFEEEESDPSFAVHATTRHMTIDEVIQRVEYTRTCISKWCKDLLTVGGHPQPLPLLPLENLKSIPDDGDFEFDELPIRDIHFAVRVGFAHRTIADFIKSKSDDGTLDSMTGASFEPLETYCHVNFRLAKGAFTCGDFNFFIHLFLTHGAKLENYLRQPLTFLTAEMNSAAVSVLPSNDTSHWEDLCTQLVAGWPTKEFSYPKESNRLCYIMLITIWFGLCRTFIEQFNIYSMDFPEQWTLIFLTAWVTSPWAQAFETSNIITWIRERGANLNAPIKGMTRHWSVWQMYLAERFGRAIAFPGGRTLYMFSFEVKELLKLGADPSAEVDGEGLIEEITIDE
jgi:hypothetical protein